MAVTAVTAVTAVNAATAVTAVNAAGSLATAAAAAVDLGLTPSTGICALPYSKNGAALYHGPYYSLM